MQAQQAFSSRMSCVWDPRLQNDEVPWDVQSVFGRRSRLVVFPRVGGGTQSARVCRKYLAFSWGAPWTGFSSRSTRPGLGFAKAGYLWTGKSKREEVAVGCAAVSQCRMSVGMRENIPQAVQGPRGRWRR